MRILVIDPDEARAALVTEGLEGIGPAEVRRCASFDEAEAAGFAPDIVVTTCRHIQALREDLAKAQADLAARKTVERAKGLLMKERGLDEEAAYRLLRKLAMDSHRPIGAVAADLIAYSDVLKGPRG
ncbi:MAG: ANTAR domain-containing response regulator [Parcubacteria group bacterium]